MAQAFQPVQTQAEACGYIFLSSFVPNAKYLPDPYFAGVSSIFNILKIKNYRFTLGKIVFLLTAYGSLLTT
ncbi:MAG: hypothetical protein ABIG94_05565 [Pseudomonadota bacterium]